MSRAKQVLLVLIFSLTVIVAAILIWSVAAEPTHAALAQQGIPVRCEGNPNPILPDRQEYQLKCYQPEGPDFTDVPASRYLLITDIVATTETLDNANWCTEVTLKQKDGSGTQVAEFNMKAVGSKTYGHHFNIPYFVLSEDHYLVAAAYDLYGVSGTHVYVAGLLVTDYTYSYLPTVFGNR